MEEKKEATSVKQSHAKKATEAKKRVGRPPKAAAAQNNRASAPSKAEAATANANTPLMKEIEEKINSVDTSINIDADFLNETDDPSLNEIVNLNTSVSDLEEEINSLPSINERSSAEDIDKAIDSVQNLLDKANALNEKTEKIIHETKNQKKRDFSSWWNGVNLGL